MKRALQALAAVAVIATLIACGASPDSGKPIGKADPSASGSTVVEPAKDSYVKPTPKDFKLDVKVTKNQCIDSDYGASVNFKVTLTQITAANFDPDKTYTMTYDVKGLDAPYTNNLEITGDTVKYDGFEYGSTKTCKPKLTAVITSVEEQ